MATSDNATHAIASITTGTQLLGIVDQRGEYDDGNTDEKDKETKNAGAGFKRGNDHLETRIVVEELEQSHDANGAEKVPGRMHLEVGGEEEVRVDEVAVEPGAVQQVDPVDDVLEEFYLVGRDEEFDDELEREPCDANVLDVVEDGGRTLPAVHRQVQHAAAFHTTP